MEFSVIVETTKKVSLDEMSKTMDKIIKTIEEDGYQIVKTIVDNDV